MAAAPTPQDMARVVEMVATLGHNGALGLSVSGTGPDWCRVELPWRPELVGVAETGVLASGPIVALLDMATSMAVWIKRGGLHPQATLDMRVDYLRAATPGRTVVGWGQCTRITRRIAFVRGHAHDGDEADPLANVAATFMFTDAA